MTILNNREAFKNKYSYDGKMKKNIVSVGTGISVGASIVGGAALIGGSTGIAGVASHLTGLWLVGGIAKSLVWGGMVSAASTVAIPAVLTSLAVFATTKILTGTKSKEIRKTSAIENLASTVAPLIFDPFTSDILQYSKGDKTLKAKGFNYLTKKMFEWGYSKEFIENYIRERENCNSATLLNKHSNSLHNIEKMNKDNLYNGCCKQELPVNLIQAKSAELRIKFE